MVRMMVMAMVMAMVMVVLLVAPVEIMMMKTDDGGEEGNGGT